jgi:hypothetical protein
MEYRQLISACLVLAGLLTPGAAGAQSSAAIVGTVRDGPGSPVPGARVVLTGDAVVFREVVTTQDGTFEFAGLLPARPFLLEAVAPGFEPGRRPDRPG